MVYKITKGVVQNMKNKRWFAGFLIIIMMISLVACGKTDASQISKNSSKVQVQLQNSNADDIEEVDAESAVFDFAVQLFQNSVNVSEQEGDMENVLIAPTSVLTALAMTANGAEEETLRQMEETLGLPREALNDYMKSFLKDLPNGEKYELHMANSIWIKDEEGFCVEDTFLETNQNYYDADIFEKAFDNNTLTEINAWVKEKTKGMIEEVLAQIPDEAVMYVINALAFEAEWEEIYNATQIRNGVFTLENGLQQEAEFMYSEEAMYLEDEKATGFHKYYADKKYAFVALLPKEEVTISEYVASLSGDKLQSLLKNPVEVQVNAAIPKFETYDEVLLNNTLESMGMEDVFDAKKADLSGIGSHVNGNLWVDRVIHKTHIEVDAKGTKAGAATVAEILCESAMETLEAKTVYLNRPFVYMIIECENNQPIFIGTTTCIFPYVKCGVEEICSYPVMD